MEGFKLGFRNESYSKFEIGGLDYCKDSLEKFTFKVKVKIISDTDGDEVVQIYYNKSETEYKRPNKKLVAFNRVSLKAGEEKEVELTADKHLLKIYDEEKRDFVFEGGEYIFMAGPNSSEVSDSIKVKID